MQFKLEAHVKTTEFQNKMQSVPKSTFYHKLERRLKYPPRPKLTQRSESV